MNFRSYFYQMNWQFTIIMLFLLLASCSTDSLETTTIAHRFEIVSDETSGINFSNTLKPNLSTKSNLLDFDYYYNGAGVGIIDVNNDGLSDIFFAGNEMPNKLYLNKGDFTFEDISATAGINSGKHWSNGVSIADVNNDGYEDIYVSQGGPKEIGERGNLLFINNGDLTFTESASTYGLQDQGISTQSAFFDYDKDGDLDCIVMNESMLYGYDPVTFHRLLIENPENTYTSYSHLYRNDGGSFTDVTRESGVIAPTFGLGLVVSDINEDGWLDFYFANDYYQPDNVYINRKDGTFADRAKSHLKQMSFFGMGADIADVNNDGHQDIFVLDMASKDHVRSKTLMASMNVENFDLLTKDFGFPYQYMFNSLQLNDGKGRFKNIAQSAGLSKTDWSWSVLMEDYNLDGIRDIFITNGYRKYGLDNDFKRKVVDTKLKYNNQVPLEVKTSLYAEIPSEPLPNLFYRQNEDGTFSDIAATIGLDQSTFSNGAAFADFDNDGDQDIVINNIDGKASLYKNNASSTENGFLKIALDGAGSDFAKISITSNGVRQMAEHKRVRGYMSSVDPTIIFGVGKAKKIDEIKVEYLDGSVIIKNDLALNKKVVIKKQGAVNEAIKQPKQSRTFTPSSPLAYNLNYSHKENEFNDFIDEVLLPYKQSTLGPAIAVDDINGDQIDDLFLGGASEQAASLYLSTPTGYELAQQNVFLTDKRYEDNDALFIDYNGDGQKDIIVISGGNGEKGKNNYAHRLYVNKGGSFSRDLAFPATKNYSGGIVKSLDFDKDGDLDLIIGNRIVPKTYPVAAPSQLLVNEAGIFVDKTKEFFPDLSTVGIVNDISVNDVDKDGWVDVVIAAEWEAPAVFRNYSGTFESIEWMEGYKGLWFSVTPIDVNKDGAMDFVFGNIGENFKLHPKSGAPLKVYAGDLDNNGTHDLVLTTEYKGNYVPVRGKECSTEQMPFLEEKFESYNDFATSTLVDIYGESDLNKAYQKEIETISSYLFINKGDFTFDAVKLPFEAQLFPMLDATLKDVNQDGNMDIIAVGNIYNTEVETPRLDMGTGLVLLGNSKTLEVNDSAHHQIYFSGNTKKVALVKGPLNKEMIVGVNNNGPLAMYQIK